MLTVDGSGSTGLNRTKLFSYTNMNKEQKPTQTTEPAIAVEPVL